MQKVSFAMTRRGEKLFALVPQITLKISLNTQSKSTVHGSKLTKK